MVANINMIIMALKLFIFIEIINSLIIEKLTKSQNKCKIQEDKRRNKINTNPVSLSGLTKALLSGYKYFYVPLEDALYYDNYYHTIYSCARNLGAKVDISKQTLIDTDNKVLNQIILVKVIGMDPQSEYIREKKKIERERNILIRAKEIRKLNSEGYNYRQIAEKLGYRSTSTLTGILKEEVKIKNQSKES